uniref:Uncharacterized protein n=1 Tax=Entomoneis paludosa TaxID=265537 RepID=A0A7S2VCN2_9STRA|mmetsp:Transcript_16208/g.33529  ORF Transcript_16208/g.33529 Transcript_16208/m.33529 type:complete len:167 (+) Transcript_16208:142-642(+)
MIHRGVETGCCGGFFMGNSDPMKERYILLKGAFCFVFDSEDSSSPLYAIKLHGMAAEIKDQHSYQGRTLVLLRAGSLGDVQYEFSFLDESTANKFKTTVTQQASAAATEETRKRLGHEHLLNKRASVRYAETVAIAKEKEQPDKPISRNEILANMAEADGMGTTPM